MRKPMIEYYKHILQKVSFDKELLAKEISKAKRNLSREEFLSVISWLQNDHKLTIEI